MLLETEQGEFRHSPKINMSGGIGFAVHVYLELTHFEF